MATSNRPVPLWPCLRTIPVTLRRWHRTRMTPGQAPVPAWTVWMSTAPGRQKGVLPGRNPSSPEVAPAQSLNIQFCGLGRQTLLLLKGVGVAEPSSAHSRSHSARPP